MVVETGAPMAATWDIDQIAISVEAIAQGPAKRSDVHRNIARLDEQIWPHASHEFLPGYEFTVALDQCDEDLESTAADVQRLFAFKQQPLCGNQTKRAK